MTVLERIYEGKIIAILRGLSLEDTLMTAKAIKDGGIKLIEIPFDQTKPLSVTTDKISGICKKFADEDVFVGAGTVLTVEQVRTACQAGATYIITPTTNEDVIREAKALGLVAMPGAMTPTEIEKCYVAGADIVKIFPSDNLGVSYIKAVRGPLSYIPIAAVGGVSLDNIRDFFAAGVCCVGIGGNIVNKKMISEGNFAGIRDLAEAYMKKLD